MDLSIVIPHCGPYMGLWATILSCEEDLRTSRVQRSYEYIIISNGQISRATAVKSIADTYDIDNVSSELAQIASDGNGGQPID